MLRWWRAVASGSTIACQVTQANHGALAAARHVYICALYGLGSWLAWLAAAAALCASYVSHLLHSHITYMMYDV